MTTTTTTTTSTSATVLLKDPPQMDEEPHQQKLQLLNSRPPHPTARAFFEALDGAKKTHTTTTNAIRANEANDHSSPIDPNKSQKKDLNSSSSSSSSSAWIQKRIQTLGWRSRYSQADQYPLQISNNDGDNEPYSFSVQQVQRGEVEGTYGTGATVWPASLVLLYYLQHQRQQQQRATTLELHDIDANKHDEPLVIVELGAGTGVVSIGAALIFGGPYSTTRITCTDGCEPVVQLARDNIRQAAHQLSQQSLPLSNDTDGTSGSTVVATINECPIQVKHYWWGTKPLPTESSDASTAQTKSCTSHNDDPTTSSHTTTTTAPKTRTMVLVSDCVLPKLYPIAPLVEALDQLLSQDSHDDDVAYISYEHRYFPEYDPRDKFRELCRAKGLQVIPIPMEEQHPVYSIDDIELWKVQRNPLKEI